MSVTAIYDGDSVPNRNGAFRFTGAQANVQPSGFYGTGVVGTSGQITVTGTSVGARAITDRELGCDVELDTEPDIDIDEARRIARHRQASIERDLRGD